MKKPIIWLVVIMMVFSFAFLGIGCKATSGETTVVDETTAADVTTAASTDAAAETTAAVVAGTPELVICSGGWWGIDGWVNLKYGLQAAEKFLKAEGVDIKVETSGPNGDDIEQVLAGIEASVAKKPIGIIIYHHNIGEDKMLNQYVQDGGMIVDRGTMMSMSPDPLPYPIVMSIGTDDLNYGINHAKWLIELMGDSFTMGIDTMTDQYVHRQRVAGMMSVFSQYPNIEIIEPYMEQGATAESAAANASAWISQNGKAADAIICTSALGASGVSTALKEAGFQPGDITVLGSDVDPTIVELIQQGWIVGTTGQAFAVQSFYAVLTLHALYNKGVITTVNDDKAGYVNAPSTMITPTFRITKDNTDDWAEDAMPLPE